MLPWGTKIPMTIVSLGVRPPRRSQKQCDALFRFSSISPCLRQPWKISSESIWTDVFLIVWAHWLRNNNFELKAAVRCIRSRLSGWFHTLRDTLEVKENVIGASQSNENKNNSKGSFQGQCLCYSGKPQTIFWAVSLQSIVLSAPLNKGTNDLLFLL